MTTIENLTAASFSDIVDKTFRLNLPETDVLELELIKVEDLGKWLRAKFKAGDEWVNIDVKESKGGKWYAAVSNFKQIGRAHV